MGVAPDEQRFDETEQAVRRLLEATVPSPAAPADRMARIGGRVRRRRRRKAAAAATALTAAAALAGVVAGERGEAPDHRQEPVATPSDTTAASARLLRPDRPVTAELPEGWHALSVEGVRGTRAGFIATQPLSRPAPGGCLADVASMLTDCRPFSRLVPGGALIVLRYGDGRDVGPVSMRPAPAVGSCVAVGADSELTGRGTGHSASAGSFEVVFSVCLRSPATTRTNAEIQDILSDMFPDDGT